MENGRSEAVTRGRGLITRGVSPWVILAFVAGCAGVSKGAAPHPRYHSKTAPPGHAVAIQTGESALLSNIRQMTFVGKRSGEGYFSADGTQLVFQSEREADNPFYQIYLMDLPSGDVRRVSPGHGKTTCGWIHPDGEKVLFASTHLDPYARLKQEEEIKKRVEETGRRYAWDFDESYELFEADPDGGSIKRLTDARGYDAEGSWSPDGRSIVFASNRHGFVERLTPEEKEAFEKDPSLLMEIYIMEADGSHPRRLTREPGYDGGPFFSPDGSKIVWRRFSEDGSTAEIFVMEANGENPRQITRLGAMSWAPYFHPAGDYIVFSTSLHGFDNFELYVVGVEGRLDPIRVTQFPGFDGLPSFSPDGGTLAWTSSRTSSKRPQLFLADWNDAEIRKRLDLPPRYPAARPSFRLLKPEITAGDLKTHVGYLASDDLKGRMTGTKGEELAVEYATSIFESLGLDPAGDEGLFMQSFDFTAGVSLGDGNRLSTQSGTSAPAHEHAVDVDWRPLAFSMTGEFGPAPVVFAGYGLTVPADEGQPEYDSFAHLDVEGKWVLMFRYFPEDVSDEKRQQLARYSGLRYKAMAVRERGGLGLLVVSGPRSDAKDQLVPMVFDASLGGTHVAAVSLSDDIVLPWFEDHQGGLERVQDMLDSGEMVPGFELPGIALSASIDIRKQTRTGHNVIARLPSGSKTGGRTVVVGAHIDHLGEGRGSSSLARGDEGSLIHYGADDNASGAAAVLEIAQELVRRVEAGRLKPAHDLVFALWSGEEIGLLGSSHYVKGAVGEKAAGPEKSESVRAPPQGSERAITAYLNLDMAGRLRDKLVLQGVGSSSVWRPLIESLNAQGHLALSLQDDSYLPTDATPFYLKGVPILGAFTGAHAEYHTPGDTRDTLNYEGLAETASLMADLAAYLASDPGMPDYIEMKKPEGMGARAGLRVYLGTIPDYSESEVAGVKLSGVVGGGPADRAGVKGGDIVVGLGGKKIENIYDYTYALDALKVGRAVEIKIVRDGEETILEIVPTSRD